MCAATSPPACRVRENVPPGWNGLAAAQDPVSTKFVVTVTVLDWMLSMAPARPCACPVAPPELALQGCRASC